MKTLHMINSTFTKVLASVFLLGALAGTAYAGPIVGSVAYSGAVTPNAGLDTATFLDFTSPAGTVIGEGSLAGLTGVGTLSLEDLTISPFAGPALVWTDIATAAGFTFNLNTLSILEQNATFLKLSGTGVLAGTGFDDTDAVWALTTQVIGTGAITTFSASSSVPEPSTLTLLGLTLFGLGLARRIRTRPVRG